MFNLNIRKRLKLKLATVIFCAKFSQKSISGLKRKKLITPMSSAYSN